MLPGDLIAGTPPVAAVAVQTFRQDGVSLELIQYSLHEGTTNLLVLVNVGESPRRFTVLDIGVDVTIPPLTQVDVFIETPAGDHPVVTYTGEEPEPLMLVPCGGEQVNAGTLRVFPAGAVAVNPCAPESFL